MHNVNEVPVHLDAIICTIMETLVAEINGLKKVYVTAILAVLADGLKLLLYGSLVLLMLRNSSLLDVKPKDEYVYRTIIVIIEYPL